jgi:outer membrane protein assembly factor BamA
MGFRILFFCLLTVHLHAQQFYLKIVENSGKKIPKSLPKSTYTSETARAKSLSDFLNSLQEEGFLTASVDSQFKQQDTLFATLHIGEAFTWSKLYSINIEEQAMSSSGFRERMYQNRSFRFSQTKRMMRKIITHYENNGYPFASLKLDSLNTSSPIIEAGLRINPGDLFHIDSVNVRGTARITPRYLYNYIGIRPGDVYNESVIRQISVRMKELPFLTETRPADVFLLENSTLIRLYLNDRKASSFNGIVGFLPNTDGTGKLLLTGEANLKLKNSLGRGELIDAEWRRLQQATQSLNVKVGWPFLFDTRIGIEAAFGLYKRDTSFLNLQQNLGVQYLMRGTDYLKVFYENKTSSLLSTKALVNLIELPDYADIRSSLYGLELSFTRLDYRLNPRKGIRLLARFGTGTRNIDKNPALNEALYDKLTLRSIQYNGHIDADFYFPIRNRSTMNLGILASAINGANVFENELFRIGGNNTLRGFNEESIFASTFSIVNLEYRYLLEENSFLFAFFNGAYYENKAVNRNIEDRPFGFGAGMSFETKAGIFSISYALGKQFDNPIEFRSAKVHFGITSLF